MGNKQKSLNLRRARVYTLFFTSLPLLQYKMLSIFKLGAIKILKRLTLKRKFSCLQSIEFPGNERDFGICFLKVGQGVKAFIYPSTKIFVFVDRFESSDLVSGSSAFIKVYIHNQRLSSQ